jgi:hypothetical protein
VSSATPESIADAVKDRITPRRVLAGIAALAFAGICGIVGYAIGRRQGPPPPPGDTTGGEPSADIPPPVVAPPASGTDPAALGAAGPEPTPPEADPPETLDAGRRDESPPP